MSLLLSHTLVTQPLLSLSITTTLNWWATTMLPGLLQWPPTCSPFRSCLHSLSPYSSHKILLLNLVAYSHASKNFPPPSIQSKVPQSPARCGYLSCLISYHSLQRSLLSSHLVSLQFLKWLKCTPISKPCTCCSFCLECSWFFHFGEDSSQNSPLQGGLPRPI